MDGLEDGLCDVDGCTETDFENDGRFDNVGIMEVDGLCDGIVDVDRGKDGVVDGFADGTIEKDGEIDALLDGV